MSLNWMQSCFELGALKINFNECQGNIVYYQEKFAQIQFELMDRIEKYEDLKKNQIELDSCLTGSAKEEAVDVELAVKENEIKILRIKLNKESEKVTYLDEKLVLMGKHKDQIDINNTSLNKTNMLLIKNR